MEERVIFANLLEEFKEQADLKGGSVTRGEVEEYFSRAGLSDEQLDMICDYLTSQYITVEGYASQKKASGADSGAAGKAAGKEEVSTEDTPAEGDGLSPEESLERYLDEISMFSMPPEPELKRLFDAAADGDAAAREELIRLYLPTIAVMAGEYEGDAILAEDLIGEGNVDLALAVSELEHQENLAAYQALLINRLSDHMQEVIRLNTRASDGTKGALGKAQHLHDAIRKLTEELEHTVSIDELSAYLEMPREEIIDILNLSGTGDETQVEPGRTKNPWEI